MNLDIILQPRSYQLQPTLANMLWYRVMRRDGKQRTATTDANMAAIFAEKDRAVRDAETLHADVVRELTGIRSRAFRNECLDFFTRFRDLAEFVAVSRKRLWVQYKFLKERKRSYRWMKGLDALIDKEKELTATLPIVREIYRSGGAHQV